MDVANGYVTDTLGLRVEWRGHNEGDDTNYTRIGQVCIGTMHIGTICEYEPGCVGTPGRYMVRSHGVNWCPKWHGPYQYPQQAIGELFANFGAEDARQLFGRAALLAGIGEYGYLED